MFSMILLWIRVLGWVQEDIYDYRISSIVKSTQSRWDYPLKQGWWLMKGISCVSLIQLQLALCSVHVLATELWWCWEDCWAVWAWWLEHTLKICSSFTSLWTFWQVKGLPLRNISLSDLSLSLSHLSPVIYFCVIEIFSLWHSECWAETTPPASLCNVWF